MRPYRATVEDHLKRRFVAESWVLLDVWIRHARPELLVTLREVWREELRRRLREGKLKLVYR